MGKKAAACCDTFSPALEVLTGSVQAGLHWGFSEGEAEQRKEIRFAERNWLQMIKESLNISSCAAGTLFFSECSSLQVSKAACILTTQTLMRLLKSREAAGAVDVKTWPTIIDTGELPGPRGSLKFCAGVSGDFQRDRPHFIEWLLKIYMNMYKSHPRCALVH